MTTDVNIEKYINKIASKCDATYSQVEEIVLTQIALSLGDLAVKNSSDIVMGRLELENETLVFHPSDFVESIIQGEIDPLYLLNEFMKKT